MDTYTIPHRPVALRAGQSLSFPLAEGSTVVVLAGRARVLAPAQALGGALHLGRADLEEGCPYAALVGGTHGLVALSDCRVLVADREPAWRAVLRWLAAAWRGRATQPHWRGRAA